VRPPLAVLLVLLPALARAHQGTVSYADFEVGDTDVRMTVLVAYDDWLPIVDLDTNHDGALAATEVRGQLPKLAAFVRGHLDVAADGAPCAGEPVDVGIAQRVGIAFTALQFLYRCPAPVRRLRIVSSLFALEHPGHRTLATVRDARGVVRQHVFGPGAETFEVALGGEVPSPTEAVHQFLALGVEHIFTGYDHICFLLGLLLTAHGLANLLKIVTAFTAAHTITLVLATLGYVTLPVPLVESVIALSITYVAVENLIGAVSGRRWMLAFAFGLVHGFGFSNVLREMDIPREVLAWSLASFNLGVEVGQVAIVSLAYPLLLLTRRTRWSTWVVRVASAAIGVAGLYWFVRRALLAP
jgi:hydrogenase/urease accessory protein HupE